MSMANIAMQNYSGNRDLRQDKNCIGSVNFYGVIAKDTFTGDVKKNHTVFTFKDGSKVAISNSGHGDISPIYTIVDYKNISFAKVSEIIKMYAPDTEHGKGILVELGILRKEFNNE